MSLSTFFGVLVCFGLYRLGALNQKHPGEVWRLAQLAWKWLNQSWK